ncbi:cysteine desulfurase-like protein [Streptomyces olivaceus]|uniref:Cysteine desulfurase-like protein n=1 Tax=Streptomyces olivaceus TaxID=47716 RepID=A0ABS7W966_STROV|nr:cysteine desulfurase-like protein [Streptomyces olivaceus]AOW85682.1 cysteine desulfurase-like protein [Streptomyces olivaceus]MBZ6091563.1 cysteine desulfurase-like protein [Streptomyces olivaceus]MBZ6098003.1 cysteine desulfurase-like protein [Streptomyces olivaceus]MBZ6118540.1 cysteine desulfurase-like protein [Streptomyces olivaceus]MBZ6154063.1 cysteine desulfurase-like protein [Streptomyces olivaceus]
MALDVEAIRAQIPALKSGSARFDAPGGTQTPQPVIDAIGEALANPLANRGRTTEGERNADGIVSEARAALGDLLATDPRGIVLGRSATQLAYDLSRTLAKSWGPGDEVVVTRLDHDSNIRPWVQAAEAAGASVRTADFDPATGELRPEHVEAVLSPRTRLVAVTAASNLVGAMPDLPAVARLAHGVGALVHVDAVHYASHAVVDPAVLGADTLVCSPYKFLGPHLGVLAARPEFLESLRPDKLLPSSDAVPERFELGTLPYELLAGTRAAVDFLAGLDPEARGSRRDRLVASFAALEAHEDALRGRIEQGLAALDGITVYSRAVRRTPTLLFTVAGLRPAEVYRHLADHGVDAPAGTFYALEASRRLGLGDEGGVRVGLAPYTDTDDVDRLLTALGTLNG